MPVRKVTSEEFVRHWFASSSLDEVAEKCGMTRNGASGKASKLRNQGVRLPYMTCPDSVMALQKLAEQLSAETGK